MTNLKKKKKWEHFFKKCHVANDFLEMKGLFLRVSERLDKFHYVIKKSTQGKNNVIRDLSSCIVQKFNKYEIFKTQLKTEEKCCHEPIDIIYEPVNDLHLAHRSYCSQKIGDDYKTHHPATRQCYYCDKYFSCPPNKFFKHVKVCSEIAGIVYKFENNKIISFQ